MRRTNGDRAGRPVTVAVPVGRGQTVPLAVILISAFGVPLGLP